MFTTATSQLRLALALSLGNRVPVRSLERVVDAMRDTIAEFGSLGEDAASLIKGPALAADTKRLVLLKNFVKQAVLAQERTEFYEGLFPKAGLNPRHMRFEDIGRLPVTTKDSLRCNPDAFLSRGSAPQLRVTTTGTTGWPTSVYFSEDELRIVVAVTTSHVLLRRFVDPDDIVQVCLSSRASIALAGVMGSCAKIGAPAYLAGLVAPATVLALLTERRSIPGKRRMTSVMDIYPSHLGEVVEYGLGNGFRPQDFGLRRLIVGGEVVTDGLKARARRLFGEELSFEENFAMTETVPMGGTQCSAGHLHYEVSAGLVEFLALDGLSPGQSAPAAEPGEPGSLVATPFAPYRQTTLLVRYDTEDVAQPLAGPLDCELADFPASSRLLGKRRLSVHTDVGWTFPRQVLEALEGLESVPLPARFNMVRVPGGVRVTALVREADAQTRRTVRDALERQGVPLCQLELVVAEQDLPNPYPLRCTLREYMQPGAGPTQVATQAVKLAQVGGR